MPTFDQIINSINHNDLLCDEELTILEVLLKKYKPLSTSKYARLTGKSDNGVKYMVKHNLLPYLEVNGEVLIFSAIQHTEP